MKADILTLETAKRIANLERDVLYYKETRDELITNNVKLREKIIQKDKKLDKYKNVIDKIKEYAKANKIIEIIALLEVEEIE